MIDYKNISKEALIKELQDLQQANKALKESFDKCINEHIQIEKELEESRVKFHGLSEASFEAIFLSEKGICIEQNHTAEIMFGYTPEEALGKPGTDWIVPEDREMVMKNMLAGYEYPYEATALRKDGTTFPCLLRGKMISYKNKMVRVTSLENITIRRQTEDALKESEALFSLFLQFSPIYIYIKEVTPTQSRVIASSDNFIDMVGIPSDKMKGKTMQELFPAEFAAKITHDDWEVVSKGNVLQIEENLNGRNYTTIKFPIERNGKTFLAGYTIDITDRKQSENMFQDIIDKNPMSIQILDLDGYTIQVNSAFMKIFGAMPPTNYSIFKDTQLLEQGFADAFEKIKLGEVVNFPNSYYNAHVFDPSFPDNPVWLKAVGFTLNVNTTEPGKIVLIHENITERKLAVEKLRESEERFKVLHNASFGGIAIHDKGVILECNQGLSEITGFSVNELIGMDGLLLIAPDYRDFVMDKITTDFEKPYEAFGIKKNGERYPIRLEARGVPFKGKKVRSVEFRDITEQKKAEIEHLAAKEAADADRAKVTAIIEGTKDSIWAYNRNYELLFFNQTFQNEVQQLFGFLLSSDFNIIENFPKELQSLWKSRYDRVLNNEQFTLEDATKTESGMIYTQVSFSPIVIKGKVIGGSCFASNITSRKLAELELLSAKEAADANSANVTAIIEGTANNIWAFNRKYEILYINQVFQREFFQTFGVRLAPGVSLIEALPEGLQPFWKPRYDRVLNNEQFTVEDAIDTGNGMIYIQVSFNPIVKNGKVIGGSCFGENITPRKLAEIELIKAKEKAEESDRLKSAFLANMSHEIRTPMNGILGFADLLKKQNLTGKQQKEYIRIIEKSGVRMLNIINDIIDISKIESGQMKLNIVESNINEQIEYINTFFKPEVEAKGMKLSFKTSLTSKEAIIKTDREKVYAILTNLVKNAIKYSIKGSIEFGYDIVDTMNATYLQCYVKDNGIGIPKNRQEAIFERFIQADIADKMARQGAGLGLSITKAYVEMLGGEIWVESEEGSGSTFYFTLPFKTKPTEKDDSNTKISINELSNNLNIKSSKLKILIAEDDETSELLISLMVEKYSKEILKVKTGLEAIDALKKNPDIDLILMDIQMPVLGGYEATRQIRQFNKEVVIIAQTAYGLSGDKENAFEAGCNDYISKPISNILLKELIQKHFCT